MGKSRISLLWLLFPVAVMVAGLIIYVANEDNLEKAKAVVAYQQAKVCLPEPGCRQIIDATVLDSKTELRANVWLPTYRQYNPVEPRISFSGIRYLITLALSDSSIQIVTIIPNEGYKYLDSFRYIYFPSSSDLHFAENNFPAGQKVKVEIWNGKITFVLADSILGYTYPGKELDSFRPTPTPVVGPRPQALLMQGQLYPDKIAIPTTNQPRIVLAIAQNKFESIVKAFFIILLFILILIGMYLGRPK